MPATSHGFTRIAALAALIGALGVGSLSITSAAELLGLVSMPSDQSPGFIFPLVLIGMIGGFALFSLADYRTTIGSNRFALFLLAPAIVFALVVGTGVGRITDVWQSTVLGTLHGLSYLGVWIGLRGDLAQPGASQATSDSAI